MIRPLALSALLAQSAAFAQPAGPLYKRPYLQQVTTDSARLIWESKTPGPFTVIVDGGELAQRPQIAEATGEAPYMLSAVIDGLTPGAEYTWGVRLGDTPIAQGTLRTDRGPEAPSTFIVYGDNRSDHRAHQAVVRGMAGEGADLWINTGDLVAVGGLPQHWAAFFAIEGEHLAETPMYPTIGNHEVILQGERLYQRYFDLPGNELYYAATWGNVRFVFMDVYIHTDHGAPNAAQQAFLLKEVAAAEADPDIDHVIGVVHEAPYSSNPRRQGNVAVRPLLERLHAAGMDALLAGHDHFYERGTLDIGMPYMVVGCGGAPLYPTVGPGEHPGYTAHVSRSVYGYVRMYSAGSTLSGCAVDLDGVAFDCFEL